jgi:hypothetical protein
MLEIESLTWMLLYVFFVKLYATPAPTEPCGRLQNMEPETKNNATDSSFQVVPESDDIQKKVSI